MGVMGLCIVVSLVGKDMLKGYIAACIGLLIGMVGTDSVSTVTRFTYGFWQLNGGFSTLPVLMGLFALQRKGGQGSRQQDHGESAGQPAHQG